MAVQDKTARDHLIKLGLDLAPLVVFFAANVELGVFWATGLTMAATLLSLIGSRLLLNRLPVMALVTGAGVLVLGGLTIWLQNDAFIKMKPRSSICCSPQRCWAASISISSL